jgi:hypothetical protein
MCRSLVADSSALSSCLDAAAIYPVDVYRLMEASVT